MCRRNFMKVLSIPKIVLSRALCVWGGDERVFRSFSPHWLSQNVRKRHRQKSQKPRLSLPPTQKSISMEEIKVLKTCYLQVSKGLHLVFYKKKSCSYIRSRVSLKVKFFTGCLETLAETARITLTFPLMTLASWFCICVDCCGASSPWPLLWSSKYWQVKIQVAILPGAGQLAHISNDFLGKKRVKII